jgi:pectinesterase
MKNIFTSIALFASAAWAASRTSAPSGCLTVGSGGYSTIQSAVNALSTSASGTQCIFIKPGTYNEQVLVPKRSATKFAVYGYTTDDTSFNNNQVTITHGLSQADGLSNDETATLRVKAAGFRLYNVNVVNSYGAGSQAVALSAYADSGYYGVKLTGYQDTLLSNEGYQIYVNTQITGATDFIFGQKASSWFEKADIRVVAKSIGYVTGKTQSFIGYIIRRWTRSNTAILANGRDGDSNPSYYVFDHSTISAADGNSVPNGAYYLGRPWRNYSRVVFQRTDMSAVINSAGWRVWSDSTPNTDHVLYGEYGNTGTGSQGTRASFSQKLSSPVAITTILGGNYQNAGYYDKSYFAGTGADVGSS